MATDTISPRNILIIHRDESFNSITGLNGSGKSNILDSICFVLGITNMTTVRAQNLQVRHPVGHNNTVGTWKLTNCRILYISADKQVLPRQA